MSCSNPRSMAAARTLVLAAVLLLGSCTSDGDGRSAETTITESELPTTTGGSGTSTTVGEPAPSSTQPPGSATTDPPTSHLCTLLPPADAGRIVATVDIQGIGMLSQVEDDDHSCRYTGRGGVELNLARLDLSAGPAGGYADVDDYLARRRAEGGEVEEVAVEGVDTAFLEPTARVLAAVKGAEVYTFHVVLEPGSPYNKPGTGDDAAEAMLRLSVDVLLARA